MKKTKILIMLFCICLVLDACDITNIQNKEISTTSFSEKNAGVISETFLSTDDCIDSEFSNYQEETQQCMSKLLLNKDFESTISIWESVQVIDLNSDSIPEIIIECCPYSEYETHYSYAFTQKNNEVFKIESIKSDTQYSYYGGLVKSYYDNNGNDIFIVDSLFGGIGTGEFSQSTIEFDGNNFNLKNIRKYNWGGDDNTLQYQYFDEEFTSNPKNVAYDEYISLLSENNNYNGYSVLRNEEYIPLDKDNACVIIAKLIDEFYKK